MIKCVSGPSFVMARSRLNIGMRINWGEIINPFPEAGLLCFWGYKSFFTVTNLGTIDL